MVKNKTFTSTIKAQCVAYLQALKQFCVSIKSAFKNRISYFNLAKDSTTSQEGIDEPDIFHPVKFGLMVLIIFFGLFFVWTLFVPLSSAAIAPGKIVVDSHRKLIQHLEGGIVEAILVKDGETVKQGQPLLRLAATQARASYDILHQRANELRATVTRLVAERDELDNIDFAPLLQASKNNIKLQKIIEGEQKVFRANRATFDGRLQILNQRIKQLQNEISAIMAQVNSQKRQIALVEEEIKAIAYLEKQRIVPKPQLLALQRELARLTGNKGQNEGYISRAKQRIGETSQQILSLKENYHRQVLEELNQARSELANIVEREKAALDTLERTTVLAPRAGKVVGLNIHTNGGVIKPGEVLMQLVPEADELVIEARVNPNDIDMVHAKQHAKVVLSALKQRTTPILMGNVKHVSADIFEDDTTGTSYYLAKVTIPPSELARLGNQRLYPGMPAEVMIVTEERTPLAYLLGPFKESFRRAFTEQ